MMIEVAVVVLIMLPPATLTAMGSRRRGNGVALTALAGVFFPISWIVWYLHDEHPYRTGAPGGGDEQALRTG